MTFDKENCLIQHKSPNCKANDIAENPLLRKEEESDGCITNMLSLNIVSMLSLYYYCQSNKRLKKFDLFFTLARYKRINHATCQQSVQHL